MMHHIPHAQLVGAVEAITDELQTLLSRGYIVEFGDLGHFSLTLSLEKEITDRKESALSICPSEKYQTKGKANI